MVYINNNTEPQVVFIPRMESIEYIRPQKGDYTEGFKDGVASQKAKIRSLTITNNGTYRNDDGFSPVVVNVPQGEGYENGFRDGREVQKREDDNSLTPVLKVAENGSYEANYGYKKVEVNVPQTGDRYEEGVEDGKNIQKAEDDAKLTPSLIYIIMVHLMLLTAIRELMLIYRFLV